MLLLDGVLQNNLNGDFIVVETSTAGVSLTVYTHNSEFVGEHEVLLELTIRQAESRTL